MGELESYLSRFREGRVDQEGGSFTLDLGRALSQLRKNRLPGAAHYVLKLVQAAVAGGAPDLSIRAESGRVELRFGWLLEADPLTCWVEPKGRAAHHLAVGLLAAPKGWKWEVSGQGSKRTLQLEGTELNVEESAAEVGDWECQFQVVCTNAASREVGSLVRKQANLAPIPIVVNGKVLKPGRYARTTPVFQRTWPAKVSEPGFTVKADGSLRVGPKEGPLGVVGQFFDQLRGPNCLHPVVDGVRLSSREFPGTFGAEYLVECSLMATDLSEFQLLEDNRYETLVRELGTRELQMRQELLENLVQLRPPGLAALTAGRYRTPAGRTYAWRKRREIGRLARI